MKKRMIVITVTDTQGNLLSDATTEILPDTFSIQCIARPAEYVYAGGLELQIGPWNHEDAIPYKPCGLNGDWCVKAWHVAGGETNRTRGLYITDDEVTDDNGVPIYSLVARTFGEDSEEGPIRSGSLAMILKEAAAACRSGIWA